MEQVSDINLFYSTVTKKLAYPTQCMKVGRINCLFLSFFYLGRTPFLVVGPHWPWTSILAILTGFYVIFFTVFLSQVKAKQTALFYLCCVGLLINLITVIIVVLKNPGIPQLYLDIILKEKLTGKSEQQDIEGTPRKAHK